MIVLKEYTGDLSQKYYHSPGYNCMLQTSIMSYIPEANKLNKTLLDVGCGHGVWSEIARNLGYKYTGIDSSNDMIMQAKKNFPKQDFHIMSATDFADRLNKKYDVILIIMLLLCFDRKEQICKTLSEAKKSLKQGGRIIVGTSHPCFDPYILEGLVRDKVVDPLVPLYQGYFVSGIKYTIQKPSGYIFNNCHWSLSDYADCITENNLIIKKIDECPPVDPPPNMATGMNQYPTYMVFVLEK